MACQSMGVVLVTCVSYSVLSVAWPTIDHSMHVCLVRLYRLLFWLSLYVYGYLDVLT